MRKNIWTSQSQYGTYPDEAKPVSKSTAYRWFKEDRVKTRRSQSMQKVEVANS